MFVAKLYLGCGERAEVAQFSAFTISPDHRHHFIQDKEQRQKMAAVRILARMTSAKSPNQKEHL